MPDTSSVTLPVTINPTIDASTVATALASALRTVAEQLDPTPVPEPPRWAKGDRLSTSDLDELPVGAVVSDADGDESTKYASERTAWDRAGLGYGYLSALEVQEYAPVTLVSLPTSA